MKLIAITLFITKYLAGDMPAIIKELRIELLAVIIVYIAMFIDFVFGVRRAMKLGIARTSYGFRRTVNKILQYSTAMLFAFLLDVLSSVIEPINLPYFSFIIAAFLVFIEFKSVRENISDKENIKQQNRDLRDVLNLLINRGKGLEPLRDQLEEVIKNEEKEAKDGKS